ncbi:hypothetical protein Lmor_0533 [Legionella moravica]|uniref:DUF4124 domain-containing protein n=1 Tax=Legionella moravica TaxID=39962 RepID=A0A378K0C9_9GAMM|nr:DUF4124 domain-containing protein [Legionella moravica]KTD37341.1 hypothetical protein Lmor_0533 [Legionella moravica]STX63182.1 Uncharacterised protein [Legionella moravica]
MSLRSHIYILVIGGFTFGLLVFPLVTYAKSGCCSHHKGVAGCNSSTGFYHCSDGTDSPSCICGYSNQNSSIKYKPFNTNTNTNINISAPVSTITIGDMTVYKWTDKKGVVHYSDKPFR